MQLVDYIYSDYSCLDAARLILALNYDYFTILRCMHTSYSKISQEVGVLIDLQSYNCESIQVKANKNCDCPSSYSALSSSHL